MDMEKKVELLLLFEDLASPAGIDVSPDSIHAMAIGDRMRIIGRLIKVIRFLFDNVDLANWKDIIQRIIELIGEFSSGGLNADTISKLFGLITDVFSRLFPPAEGAPT